MHKIDWKVYVILLQKTFMLFKIYTKDQNQKGKYYAFKDFFILDCIQKMLYPAQVEHENVSGINRPLATTSSALR